ncbi:MAG TPA: lipocalin family protein [Paracoccaceae bacterium]|nr:lipocalin family protein [Paracoccaceae bacterium]HMO71758.1 lipocalin family protein [Paracoccaceae bacterium]
MRWLALATALAACTAHVPSGGDARAPMATVDFAPERLAGTWYQVAAFPAAFQRGCTQVTATYTPRPDGTVGVANRCQRGGRLTGIDGVAEPVGPGRLKVRLQGVPFAGDFRVLSVLDDGRAVVIGTGGRTAGWVLSRDPMPRTPRLFEQAQAVFAAAGYDPARLERTMEAGK